MQLKDETPGPTSTRRRIVVASDHRGYTAKGPLLAQLVEWGFAVDDLGCDNRSGCDYPDFAAPAARGVVAGDWDAAILLDGSGIGMGIVANKVPGCRAATCHDEVAARLSREHNHANVLCLGVDLIGPEAQLAVVQTFLNTTFSAGRHLRRLAKIEALERQASTTPNARSRTA
jgi:ribose 5-phosphate isomerase B